MAIKNCTVDKAKKTITIVMDLEEPRDSKSGKTVVIASTNGNQPTNATYDGKVVVAGVNLYFKEAKPAAV